MKNTAIALLGLFASASQLVTAHPGHGAEHTSETLHSFFGSEHLLLVASIGVAAFLLRRRADGSRHDKG